MKVRAAGLFLAALAAAGCQGRTPSSSARDAAAAPQAAVVSPPAPNPEPAKDAPLAPAESPAIDAVPAAAPADAPAPDAGGTVDPLWRVKDNKVRCVRAPCPTLDALPVNSSEATAQVVEVDLSALGLSPKDEQRLLSLVYGEGLRVRGRVEERVDKRGRPYKVLKATGLGPK